MKNFKYTPIRPLDVHHANEQALVWLNQSCNLYGGHKDDKQFKVGALYSISATALTRVYLQNGYCSTRPFGGRGDVHIESILADKAMVFIGLFYKTNSSFMMNRHWLTWELVFYYKNAAWRLESYIVSIQLPPDVLELKPQFQTNISHFDSKSELFLKHGKEALFRDIKQSSGFKALSQIQEIK